MQKKAPNDDVIVRSLFFEIPAAGVEPARPRGHWILSPARLPIPPRRHVLKFAIFHFVVMERR